MTRDDKQKAHDLGVGSLICVKVYQYPKLDNVESHAVFQMLYALPLH